MTLPNPGPGVSLSILQIYNEAQLSTSSPWYNKGTNLGAYRGVQWWKDNSQTGTFPTGTIRINDFGGTRSTTPVTPGSAIYRGSGGFTVPLYSAMTIVVRGGGGGGGGASGNVRGGDAGSAGGTSYFGGYGAGGGAGGPAGGGSAAGSAGAGSDGTPAGGAGGDAGIAGTNGWSGGAGGKTVVYLSNPVSGGSGPSVGSSVYVTVGGGGNGGTGGQSYNGIGVINLNSGSAGTAGYVEIYWS